MSVLADLDAESAVNESECVVLVESILQAQINFLQTMGLPQEAWTFFKALKQYYASVLTRTCQAYTYLSRGRQPTLVMINDMVIRLYIRKTKELKDRQKPLEAVRSDPFFRDSCKLIFRMLDTDRDGHVTLAEFTEEWHKVVDEFSSGADWPQEF